MADIQIIMSAPMILALLAGQKTMTRRLAWRDAGFGLQDYESQQLEEMDAKGWNVVGEGNEGMFRVYKPTPWQRVKSGDRLWVRENLCQRQGEFLGIKQNIINARYAADEAEVLNPHGFNLLPWWKGAGGLPSIHMPRWASRITILVNATKIEPLQNIDEADADAEGIVTIPRSLRVHGSMDGYGAPGTAPEDASTTRVNGYRALWRTLHGADSWDANPEVVAMSGRVVIANIDSAETQVNA